MSSLADIVPYEITDDLDFEQEDFRKDKLENLDYKMVTFTLGGKDFGIDIMKVKEISKANRFTYVPNAAPFVRGVYNLRGDIISIIDLRILFNVQSDKVADAQGEQMIILRLEGNTIGVIVDSIDKVVAISSNSIQPPHPIFGDINIQFISGIVENESRLYIILDVERIFTQKKDDEGVGALPVLHREEEETSAQKAQNKDLDYTFTTESLASLSRFYVSPFNQDWTRQRVEDWRLLRQRSGKEVQMKTTEEADEFLASFYSSFTGILWDEDYRADVKTMLPSTASNIVNVWNLGCSSGFETYSMACILSEKYPGKRVKVWAHDNNLIEISSAPAMVVQKANTPSCYDPYLTETKSGFQFSTEIKEMILFEYHDIVNNNHVPPMDVVMARDLLSFLSLDNQKSVMAEIKETLKPSGLLLLGQNETLESPDWKPVKQGKIKGFIKL